MRVNFWKKILAAISPLIILTCFFLPAFLSSCGGPSLEKVLTYNPKYKVFGKVQNKEEWYFVQYGFDEHAQPVIVKVPMHKPVSYELDVANGQYIKVLYTTKERFDFVKEGDTIDCSLFPCFVSAPYAERVTDSEVEKHGGKVR